MSKGFLKSSIGKKMVMGLTGLFLISFLAVHCFVNALIFFDQTGELFNQGAHFMGTNWIIRAMEVVLFAGLLTHIFQSLILTLENKKARPVGYAKIDGAANSRWYSRSMGLLGTLLLLFLIMHIYHFWTPSRLGGIANIKPLEEITYSGNVVYHNLYAEMINVFHNPVAVVLYVLGCISLAYHLLHGFQSAFQTIGLNHKKYTPAIKTLGAVFAILVPLIFASMPVYLYIAYK
ncbi:MAG: succinate dehydrogenase cytochrome b subunit [Bacteroidetes bacterium]|nr:succinate dehydrogenase cytochrome b subunit [Bacteroidota bacterium]